MYQTRYLEQRFSAVSNSNTKATIPERPETYCSQVEDADFDTEWLSGYDIGAVEITFISDKEVFL